MKIQHFVSNSTVLLCLAFISLILDFQNREYKILPALLPVLFEKQSNFALIFELI